MVITSLENQKIKDIVKLQSKKYRDITNTFVVETEHLVEEAIKAGVVKEIFVVDGYSIDYPNVCYVSVDVMKKISSMESPSNFLAVCNKCNSNEIIGNKILLLDGVQDPGNLGTIIRSSVAFDVSTIVLSKDTVDLYNPKVIRASEGMMYHINIVIMDLEDAINIIKSMGINVYGTNVVDGYDVSSIEDKSSYALIMGNEGNGVKLNIQELCDKNLYISMNSKAESLNVGVACSILLYELGK